LPGSEAGERALAIWEHSCSRRPVQIDLCFGGFVARKGKKTQLVDVDF
jgi:hypothetical protein